MKVIAGSGNTKAVCALESCSAREFSGSTRTRAVSIDAHLIAGAWIRRVDASITIVVNPVANLGDRCNRPLANELIRGADEFTGLTRWKVIGRNGNVTGLTELRTFVGTAGRNAREDTLPTRTRAAVLGANVGIEALLVEITAAVDLGVGTRVNGGVTNVSGAQIVVGAPGVVGAAPRDEAADTELAGTGALRSGARVALGAVEIRETAPIDQRVLTGSSRARTDVGTAWIVVVAVGIALTATCHSTVRALLARTRTGIDCAGILVVAIRIGLAAVRDGFVRARSARNGAKVFRASVSIIAIRRLQAASLAKNITRPLYRQVRECGSSIAWSRHVNFHFHVATFDVRDHRVVRQRRVGARSKGCETVGRTSADIETCLCRYRALRFRVPSNPSPRDRSRLPIVANGP